MGVGKRSSSWREWGVGGEEGADAGGVAGEGGLVGVDRDG